MVGLPRSKIHIMNCDAIDCVFVVSLGYLLSFTDMLESNLITELIHHFNIKIALIKTRPTSLSSYNNRKNILQTF